MKRTVCPKLDTIFGKTCVHTFIRFIQYKGGRPDYKKLNILKQLFPRAPIMALSATCPPNVLKDLLLSLRLQDTTEGTCEMTPNFHCPVLIQSSCKSRRNRILHCTTLSSVSSNKDIRCWVLTCSQVKTCITRSCRSLHRRQASSMLCATTLHTITVMTAELSIVLARRCSIAILSNSRQKYIYSTGHRSSC
jgi:hypothetical protein